MSSHTDIDQERKQHQKEAIERRDRVQGVVSDLQDGKIPTTAEITQSIDKVTQTGALQESAAEADMSSAGRKAMADAEKVLDTTKRILEEKNSNDELQNALYHGVRGLKGTAGTAKTDAEGRRRIYSHTRAGGETAAELAQEAFRRTWNVARVIITSSEFRRLMNDLQQVIQDAVHAGLSNNEENKVPVGANIGNDEESSPREAVSAIGNTGRQQVGNVYTSATSAAEPVITQFSQGEVSAKEAGKELGKKAARGIRSTIDNVELSEEQRDILVARLKKILLEAHASDEFQSALDDLLEIVREIARRGEGITSEIGQTAQKAGDKHDQDLEIAQNNAKLLVERFANGKSLDSLVNSITEMGRDLRQDEELHGLMDDINEFVHRSLRDTDFINEVNWNEEASALLQRSRQVLSNRYRECTDNIMDEGRSFIVAMQKDEITNELANDLERLTADLFLDDNGRPTIKFELVKDFVKLVPIVASKLEYLALPKIEYSDDEYDYIMDNIVLRCSNIIPRYMHIHTDTEVNITPPGDQDRVQEGVSIEKSGVDVTNRVQIEISHIRAHATDMAFYYNKKTGIAKMMDVGYADMTIPDKGLQICLTLVQADEKDRANLFKVEKAETKIHEFKLKLHDTKHDFLYKLLSPIINSRVKKQAEKAISQQMTQVIFQLDQQIAMLSDKATKKSQQAGNQVADKTRNAANVASDKLARAKQQPVEE